MRRIRSRAMALLTLAVFAAVLAGVPAVASAAPHSLTVTAAPIAPTSAPESSTAPKRPAGLPPLPSCPESSLCLYQNSNLEGTRWSYGISKYSQNEWHYVGSEANDRASSWWNNRVHSSYVSQNYPASGGEECLSPEVAGEFAGEYWAQNGDSENDSVSAFNLLSYVGC